MVSRHPLLFAPIGLVAGIALLGFQNAPVPARTVSRLSDPFAAGWMLADTNGSGIINSIAGKVVVPAQPDAAENAAAADVAARLGFATTGLTPPVVIAASADHSGGPRIWIGRQAVPAQFAAEAGRYQASLEVSEGGVFAIGGNLAVLGKDDAGLLAAAEAFAARAPFLWKVPGDRLTAIAEAIQPASPAPQLVGISYVKGRNGIARAWLAADSGVNAASLTTALASPKLALVHQMIARVNGQDITATNEKAQPVAPTPPPGEEAGGAAGGAAPDAEGATQRLDIATLYTMRGLFRGTAAHADPFQPRWPALCAGGEAGNRDGEPGRADGSGDNGYHFAAGHSCG